MNKRTLEIISVLKGHHKYETDGTQRSLLVAYMSDVCDCPADVYTDELVLSIMRECVMDYLRTSEQPHMFMFDMFEAHRYYSRQDEFKQNSNLLLSVCLMSALSLVQVASDGKCINGFDENSIQMVYPKNTNVN